MNLYDLSIGEDKMNQFLSIALKTHFESLKVGGKGENYWQCYQAFLKYCDIYGDCDLKDLFNNKLLRQDIVCACASYYNSSAKAHRKEAVNRFLSAIDLFYKNYIKKMGGIECSALEGGCRNNEMIEDIEKCLNTKLKQEIYCPIDDKIEIEIIKICNNLKKSDFYKFGQKILCNPLLKYGFTHNEKVLMLFDGMVDVEDNPQLFEDIKEGFVEDYIPLPGQYDINEYRIMEEFIYELPAGKNQDVLAGEIQGRGAFRRFKDKLYDLNLEKHWYQYRDEVYEKIATQWCERYKIDIVE